MQIRKKESATLPTEFGEFLITVYEDDSGSEHAALVRETSNKDSILVRIHSECLTGDVFHSIKCDCRKQLEGAIQKISENGGIILYLRQEGRGIGLLNKIKAYNLQDRGMDTVEANEHLGFGADERDYTIAALILKDLNKSKIKLLTNNPKKIEGLKDQGIDVTERVPLLTKPTDKNINYLKTKKEKLGHQMEN